MAVNWTISTIFSAVDKLSPSTKQMQKSCKNLQSEVKGLSDSFNKMKGVITGIIGAAVVKKAADAVVKFAETGDEIAKTARTYGLAAEALQELRYAANMQGMTNEELDASFKKLTQNVGAMQSGTGSLEKQLSALNPALARTLKESTSTEEAFMAATEAIANETDQMKKAALANALFGKAGEGVIKMASGGTDAIKALREEAQAYGVISQEDAEASEAFGDSLSRVKTTCSSLANVALAELMKQLQPIVQQMAEFIKDNREFLSLKIKEAFDGITQAVKVVVALWDSGLIPAVLAGVAAYKAIMTIMETYKVVTTAVTTVQLALNGALAANPVGLIVTGIAALIAVLVLLYQQCEPFREFVNFIASVAIETFKALLDAVKALLDPWKQLFTGIKSAWDLLLSGDVVGALKQIGKTILDFVLAPLKNVLSAVSNIPGIGKLAKGALNFMDGSSGSETEKSVPMSSNAAVLTQNSYSETNNRLAVEFDNLPQGAKVKSSGKLPPNITVATGRYR